MKTRSEIDAERDRLFSVAIEGPCLLDKKLMWNTAFDAAVQLMVEREKELLDTVEFAYKHLESMDGYSLVNGARYVLGKALNLEG